MELIDTEFFRGVLGEPGTNVPSFPIILGYSVWAYHKFANIPAYDIMKNAKKHAAAQLYVAEEYSLPFVVSFTDLNIIGESLGTKLTYMPEVIPIFESPAIYRMEDIEKLEPSNPLKDGRMPIILDTCSELNKKFRVDQHILSAGVEGPFTAASSVCGMENLMRNTINKPDLVHKALQLTTDTIIYFLNQQLERGMDMVVLSDPSASCSCISPNFFKEFVFPYYKQISRKVDTVAILLHICGEAYDIIESVIKIPKILVFSVDNVNLKEAKNRIGKKFVILMGNVPTEVLRYGTVNQVEKYAQKSIREAAIGGKYLLSSACDLAPYTPPENIRALIKCGNKFGTFPID